MGDTAGWYTQDMRKDHSVVVGPPPVPLFMPDGVLVPLCGKNSALTTKVSYEDYPLVVEFKWYLSSAGYAMTAYHRTGLRREDHRRTGNASLHRVVMGDPPGPGLVIDHINGDRLDNRRGNLRWVTMRENNQNMAFHRGERPSPRNPWGYLGVSKGHGCASWCVRVGTATFGHYSDPLLAARVYDAVVRATRPRQPKLNFPDDPLPADFLIPGLNAPIHRAEFTSSVRGVSWFRTRRRWRVIMKKKTLAYFQTKEEAETFRLSLGDA